MFKRSCLITLLLIASMEASAEIKLHPMFTFVESITPHTAITRSSYGTDYYSAIGGSVDIVFNAEVTLTPGYQLGVDVLGGQTDTYSNPTLVLSLAVTDKVKERLKYSGIFSNVGGYHAETFGVSTYISPNPILELEITPQYFFDSIQTQQLEIDVDLDFNLGKRWQLNTDAAVGRTYVAHIMDLTSYSAGGGATYTITTSLKVFASVDFAHGLNTDSPYSILNSTSTINTQTGSRPVDFGNTALDPNGNTINISVGTSLNF